MALPYTFAQVGWLVGTLLLCFFMVLSIYSGLLLWKLHLQFPYGVTYGNLAEAVFEGSLRKADFYKRIIFTFVYSAFFGNLAINMLLCTQCLQNIFGASAMCSYWYGLIVCALLLLPAQLRTLHHVSYAGIASTLAIIAAVALILWSCFSTWNDDGGREAEPTAMVNSDTSFIQAFSASTSAVFAFGGQGLYLETMAEMKEAREFKKSLLLTSFFIMLFYLLSTFSIYFRFGRGVDSNALMELPDGWMKQLASAAMLLHVLVSYLLANQVIGRAIHVRVAPNVVNKGDFQEKAQWFCITASILLLSWILSNAIPFLSNLMGIVASISTAPLSFGFPAYFYMVASIKSGRKLRSLETLALYVMIFCSAVLLFLGTAVNLIQLARDLEGSPFSC